MSVIANCHGSGAQVPIDFGLVSCPPFCVLQFPVCASISFVRDTGVHWVQECGQFGTTVRGPRFPNVQVCNLGSPVLECIDWES